MVRKIAIIFIQVFLAQEGKIVQALTMLVFLTLCMGLTGIKRPFDNVWLNSLEELSLLSSSITVFCGIFFIANNQMKPESGCKPFHLLSCSLNELIVLIVPLQHYIDSARALLYHLDLLLPDGIPGCLPQERPLPLHEPLPPLQRPSPLV